jgi:hypothetical protein
LFATAAKLQHKYASIDASTISSQIQQSIQTAVGNASTVKSSGIMPFLQMLKKSNSTLSISITRNGEGIAASSATVNPGYEAPKYASLPMQIQSYLEKNLELFPTQRNGESVSYNNFTVNLTYGVATQKMANR